MQNYRQHNTSKSRLRPEVSHGTAELLAIQPFPNILNSLTDWSILPPPPDCDSRNAGEFRDTTPQRPAAPA